MKRQIIIVVNPYCHQGKGWQRWMNIRDDVNRRLGLSASEIILEKGVVLEDTLSPVLDSNQTIIISAGGDGSIHYLVNYLLSLPQQQLEQITIGAIGLGSSNDFLKPYESKIQGIPVRININGPALQHDIGVVDYSCANGEAKRKYFIVNASFGVTAEANWKFNHPGPVLQWLKRTSTASAILYTAVSTIFQHHNTDCIVQFNQQEYKTAITNVNILKLPFVSGSFYYKQPIQRDDGWLSLNICSQMNRWEMITALHYLQHGIFNSSQKKQIAYGTSFQLSSASPVVFECDGETGWSDSVTISARPRVLNVLKS
jgi:diacylglycerol kinase (ATP)